MVSRKTMVLALALLFLLALAYFLEGTRRREREMPEGVPGIFIAEEGDAVTRLEIRSFDEETILKKEPDGWLAGGEGKYYVADPEAIEDIIEMLPELNRGKLISSKKEKHDSFMVDENEGLEVAVYSGEKRVAHFFIGKQGPDFFSSYVRPGDADEVLLVKGYQRPLFDRELKNWRDRRIISFEPARAVSVEITRPAGSLILEKKEGRWFMTSPEEAEADELAADKILSRISSLQAVDFVEEPQEDFGFEEPSLVIDVVLEDGSRQGLIVGRFMEGENRYYAKAAQGRTIYTISNYIFNSLNVGPVDLIPQEEPEEAGSIRE